VMAACTILKHAGMIMAIARRATPRLALQVELVSTQLLVSLLFRFISFVLCSVSHCYISDNSGDGICDGFKYLKATACNKDGGDCDEFVDSYPDCNVPQPSKVGDGYCGKPGWIATEISSLLFFLTFPNLLFRWRQLFYSRLWVG